MKIMDICRSTGYSIEICKTHNFSATRTTANTAGRFPSNNRGSRNRIGMCFCWWETSGRGNLLWWTCNRFRNLHSIMPRTKGGWNNEKQKPENVRRKNCMRPAKCYQVETNAILNGITSKQKTEIDLKQCDTFAAFALNGRKSLKLFNHE